MKHPAIKQLEKKKLKAIRFVNGKVICEKRYPSKIGYGIFIHKQK